MIKHLLIILYAGLVLSVPTPDDTRPEQTGGGNPKVTTPLGEVEGTTMRTRLGKPIYAFRGIRYAKPPVNELRFQPPVPYGKWLNVYNATQDGPSCPQVGYEPISEDCLVLNVYSTKLPRGNENPKRPVIVYIHPGAFYSMSSSSVYVGPQYLLDQDVVLVTFNYRLGAFGFLSTGDKEAPGNMGLKDQVLVLKWVKENIVSFGGNPDSVTILGYSAGGFSVTLHMLSPLSRGLFHKAVAMSGSYFGQYSLATNQLELAKKQAQLVGCTDVETSANIMKCLKTKMTEEIVNSQSGFKEFGEHPLIYWGPTAEGEFGQERFLEDHPLKLATSGQFTKVPFLSGITTDEFADKAFNIISNATLLEQLDKEFEKYAPIAFLYERNTENSKQISKALRSFYFGVKSIDTSTLPNLAQLYADALIGFGVNRGVRVLSENPDQKVYYYRFNYKGRYSYFYLPDSNGTVPYGVIHGDDLIYLFYNSKKFPKFTTSDPESQTVEKLTTILANFARTGIPIPEQNEKLDNVKWEPFTTKNMRYLEIGNKLQVFENLYEKRYAEWDKLFPISKFVKNYKKTVG